MTLIDEFKPNDLDKVAIIWRCVFAVLIIGSGAVASALAERKAKDHITSFLLGILMPVVYPILLSQIKKDAAVPVVEEVIQGRNKDPDAVVISDDLNAEYFRRLPTDETGTRPGPFIFETESGILSAEFIADVQSAYLLLAIRNAQGQLQKIRTPYDKIVSCDRVEFK